MKINTGNTSMDAILTKIAGTNAKARKLLEYVNGDFSKLSEIQQKVFYKEIAKRQRKQFLYEPEERIPSELRTEEDIEVQRNIMAFGDGNYPLSMTNCEVVGISGGCGHDCPVYKSGEVDECSLLKDERKAE